MSYTLSASLSPLTSSVAQSMTLYAKNAERGFSLHSHSNRLGPLADSMKVTHIRLPGRKFKFRRSAAVSGARWCIR